MSKGRVTLSSILAFSLVACGGGGSSGSGTPGTGGTPTPTPTPTPTACSLEQRQQFVDDVLNEWYLFPDLLATNVNKSSYSDLQSYIDALVAPARAQSKDRYFTYITSIAEEEALISGSSAGFGIRLAYDTANNRVFVLDAYENAPGLGAGIDRGTELLAIGTTSSDLQSVTTLMASGGPQAVIDALGPSDPGITRTLQFRTASGVTTEASIAKADYTVDPISDRYGVKIFDDAGKKVGYINLRTFIVADAADQLRDAFGQLKTQGVTEIIIDLRYNGGGLVSVAEVFGDLMASGRVGQVFSNTILRDSKSGLNETRTFQTETNAIAPTKVAFIGRSGTASASELIINAMLPYLGTNMALVGANTYGKPVGQFGFDLTGCDDRLRAVAFKTTNANDEGEYYTGLSSVVPNTCLASDDIFTPLGDPTEPSISVSLDFLAGRSCTAITDSGTRTTQSVKKRVPLQPVRPTAAQFEMPGLF